MSSAAPEPRYQMEAYKPETWPPLADFKDQWDARFPDGYRVAEYVVARVEYECITGHRPVEADDGKPGMFGRDEASVVNYWRLFWTFDGPLYKPFQIEFYDEPGGPAWRVEARQMRFIPEHERRTIVSAYWAHEPAKKTKGRA